MTKSILYGLTDADRFVYHYTKASTLTEHILPTNKILFSRFQNVNDPRESKDWEFGLQSSNWDLNIDVDSVKAVFNRHLKHDWRIGCFVSDVIDAVATKEREDAGADMLATLYERGYSRPRMWAQYGDGYRGACLIFDRSKLDLAARLHARSHFLEILFLKARDWEAEREFRWVVNEPTNNELFVNISDSLAGIIAGDFCTSECKRAVGKYAIDRDLEIAQMGWRNGVPQPEPSHPRLFANAV